MEEKKQTNTNKKSNFHFGTQVVLPFFVGVLGAGIAATTVLFTVPNFINTTTTGSVQNNSGSIVSITDGKGTSKDVSLSNYSEISTSVAEQVLKSVVRIEATYPVSSYFTSSTTAKGGGSGIILTTDGYIVTNNHIINPEQESSYYALGEAQNIKVYIGEDEENGYDAKVVGTDETTDIALLKIEAENLTAAKLGDSDKTQVGEFAMVVGNPLSMNNSVTSGIISGKNRKITTNGKTLTLIQTDAAINSGNSGGALANANGEVIGIAVMKFQGTGIDGMNFAIPISSSVDIINQLAENGKVIRPYIGISGLDVDESTAKANDLVQGVYIKKVYNFSPAEKAGIEIGDVVVKIDGQEVKTMDQINEIKNSKSVGDEITITVYRDKQYKDIKVKLVETPETTTSINNN